MLVVISQTEQQAMWNPSSFLGVERMGLDAPFVSREQQYKVSPSFLLGVMQRYIFFLVLASILWDFCGLGGFLRVERHWYHVIDTLVRAFVVVVFNVILDTFTQFKHIVSWVEIDIFSLDGSPETFNPYIVQTPAPSVHTHFYSFTSLFPGFAGVLASLV